MDYININNSNKENISKESLKQVCESNTIKKKTPSHFWIFETLAATGADYAKLLI